jgi:hypothetical protein
MNEYPEPRILICGDTGISVEFGNEIDPDINHRVQQLFSKLVSTQITGILGLNPTHRSLFIQYDPWRCSFENLLLAVEECLESGSRSPSKWIHCAFTVTTRGHGSWPGPFARPLRLPESAWFQWGSDSGGDGMGNGPAAFQELLFSQNPLEDLNFCLTDFHVIRA